MSIIPSSPLDPPQMVPINMISINTSYDLWLIPHPDEIESYGTTMPLTPTETSYETTQSVEPFIDYDLSHLLEEELD